MMTTTMSMPMASAAIAGNAENTFAQPSTGDFQKAESCTTSQQQTLTDSSWSNTQSAKSSTQN